MTACPRSSCPGFQNPVGALFLSCALSLFPANNEININSLHILLNKTNCKITFFKKLRLKNEWPASVFHYLHRINKEQLGRYACSLLCYVSCLHPKRYHRWGLPSLWSTALRQPSWGLWTLMVETYLYFSVNKKSTLNSLNASAENVQALTICVYSTSGPSYIIIQLHIIITINCVS